MTETFATKPWTYVVCHAEKGCNSPEPCEHDNENATDLARGVSQAKCKPHGCEGTLVTMQVEVGSQGPKLVKRGRTTLREQGQTSTARLSRVRC